MRTLEIIPDKAQYRPNDRLRLLVRASDGRSLEGSSYTYTVALLERMKFDGIHLDQYGFPKKAIRKKNGKDEVVALKDLYSPFINLVREEMRKIDPDLGVAFNNVSNYPTHTTAAAGTDIMYIEIWDPACRYHDLKLIIDNARRWSGE